MIYSLAMVLNTLFNLLELAIFIECIASWIPQIQGNKFISIIHNFTYPLLEPFRKLQDRFSPGLPMDFSPIIALFVIDLLKRIFSINMKEKISKYFTDDDRNEALNLYERYLLSKDKNIPMFGKNFYTPNIWSWFEKNLCSKDFKIETNGFFEDAERRMISFNNIYENPFPMKLIKIQNTSKFSNLTHRDFLGGILSLGIERNKIGDLLVDKNICYVPVYEEIENFIIYNIDKISKVVCSAEVIDNFEFLPKVNFKEEIILVSSLRIDGVVSKIINVSRSKATEMIEQGQVLINYVKIKDKSYELKGEERITIRGFGKFILGNSIGNSKSGRIKIIIKKYT